jgi:hypothetical protein
MLKVNWAAWEKYERRKTVIHVSCVVALLIIIVSGLLYLEQCCSYKIVEIPLGVHLRTDKYKTLSEDTVYFLPDKFRLSLDTTSFAVKIVRYRNR